MSFQKHPVGLQDFEKIITDGFVYVDKTQFVHKLADKGGYYSLSRPTRCGQSLFISTPNYLFKEKKERFKGLFIENKWQFEEYPVIRISFSEIGHRNSNLDHALELRLTEIAREYSIQPNMVDNGKKFRELIHELHNKFTKKVILLIDEYDKPFIDYLEIENIHLARENRSILKCFYSVLKDADPQLKLVLITGIRTFSQVRIFSDLNNLYGLTLEEEYNEICGISQQEAESYSAQEIEKFNRQKTKECYNDYRWNRKGVSVDNPFSLLNFFSGGGEFQNFWFSTGTTTFLMSREQKFYALANQQVKDKQYLAAHKNLGKPMHVIGVNFSRQKKEIEALVWVTT